MKNLFKALFILLLIHSSMSNGQDYRRKTIDISENNTSRVYFDCRTYGDSCFRDMGAPERLVDVVYHGINANSGNNTALTLLINCRTQEFTELRGTTGYEKPKKGTMAAAVVREACRL